MPESEPKPRLIEQVGPGAGAGWRATLRDGKPVVVHEIQVPQAEAAAAVPRLQRLYDHRHPALSPVLAWGIDNSGVWIAVDPNEGTPLGTILTRGPLTPPAAAALGTAVLSGIAALHEAGIALGGFNAAAVRVTSNGDVRLAGHPAAAVRGAPSQSDLRADVRSCGMAVCAAFGVDPAGAPAPPNIPPGLVVTMRSMASGAMGPSADRAQSALREMASALLAPDRQIAAQSELALRSGGREVPPITPFLPKQEGVAPAAPAPAPILPQPPAPAPFTPPTREQAPARQSGIYEAPDRPLQTYPAVPAYRPEPTADAPPAPPAPTENRPSPPTAVPTWADAPPRTSPPEAGAPAARTTFPPAPEPPAAAPPVEPAGPRSPFESVPSPAPATNPPAQAPAMSPPPAPSWTPAEPPVWKPGEAATPPAGTQAAPPAPAPPPPAPVAPPAPPAPVAPPAPTFTPAAPVPPPTPAPSQTRPPMPAPARKATVARPPYSREPSGRPSWLIPAAVAVVVLLLLGIGGVILVGSRNNPGGGPVAQTSPSPRATTSPPKTTPSAGASPSAKTPLAVPATFGPASADPITKVLFCTTATPCPIAQGVPNETATACDLNSCTVEVAFYFSSPQKSVQVSYNLKFFDRCSGQTTDLAGPTASTAASGYIVAIPADKWPVRIPSGVKSGALIAVAQKPAVAASAPLLLGSDTTC